MSDSRTGRRLIIELAAAARARLFLNTSRRFAYPFAPALARGLEVPLTRITSLVALNQGMGLMSPILGPLADRWGPRAMMLIGLVCLAGGMLAAAALPFYATVLLALAMAGLAKSCFDPALQAYVGARVPWERRGLAIGLLEFAWAGSSLIGIPVVGWLIGRLGWRSPFLVLGVLAVSSLGLLAALLPRVPPSRGSAPRAMSARQAGVSSPVGARPSEALVIASVSPWPMTRSSSSTGPGSSTTFSCRWPLWARPPL